MKEFTAIVLAAGKGKRLKSSLPKVLCDLSGKPLIHYVLSELLCLKKYVKNIIVVVGYKGKLVEKEIKSNFSTQDKKRINFVYQAKLLGTANAVVAAKKKVKHGNILILCGDVPLITSKTLLSFISFYFRKKLSCSVMTATFMGKNTLGVVSRDAQGKLTGVKEKLSNVSIFDTGLNKRQLVSEVNSGIYCFKREALFNSISKIRKNIEKQEYFLTDTIGILCGENDKIDAYCLDDCDEIIGINTRNDLFTAERVMRARILSRFVDSGVNIVDPTTTFIQEGVIIGEKTTIYPFTFIEKNVIIGSNCFLGPFIHLRKGTFVGDNAQLGNFLEINRTKIGKNIRAKHFGYLGDAILADNVNIGAGTVVANFDGKSKHKTYIQKNAFIGSDTVLVAPVTIGQGGVTGAGSVVTKNVTARTVVAGVPAKPLRRKKAK